LPRSTECRKRIGAPAFASPDAMLINGHDRALRLLTNAPHGRTVADMMAHGITNATLDRLVRDGLATTQPGTVLAGTRRITVVWVAITEAGQRALTGNLGRRAG
jgi:hypothetical protein